MAKIIEVLKSLPRARFCGNGEDIANMSVTEGPNADQLRLPAAGAL